MDYQSSILYASVICAAGFFLYFLSRSSTNDIAKKLNGNVEVEEPFYLSPNADQSRCAPSQIDKGIFHFEVVLNFFKKCSEYRLQIYATFP